MLWGQTMSNKECIKEAIKTMSKFTDADLIQYINSVFEKARTFEDTGSMQSIDRAIKEINNEMLEALFRDTQTKVNNAIKTDRAIKGIKEGKFNLREFLIRRYKNIAGNVESAQKAAKGRLENVLYNSMRDEEFNFLIDKKNNVDIVRALDNKTSSSFSKGLASKIDEYLKSRTDEIVRSNALPIEYVNDDRFFRNIHNPSKLLKGGMSLISSALNRQKYTIQGSKSIWKTFIKQHLDLKKTFQYTKAVDINGEIIDSEVDNILDNIFDNIVTGKNDIFSRSEIVNGLEEIKKRRRMFFKFKDWESFNNYNNQYGTGDFFSALQLDVHTSGNRIGIAEMLGSSPNQSYFSLIKAQQATSPETSNWLSKGKSWYKTTDIYYKEVFSLDKSPESVTLANFGSNIRSLSSMGRLFTIALKSLPDIAYISSYAARFGISYMNAYGTIIKNLFNNFPSEERQYIAKQFRGMLNAHLGYIGRFVDANNSSEIVKKASTWYYRKIGLNAYDKGNKVSILHLMSSHLGNLSDKSFSELNEDLRFQLGKFDISDKEWDLLRRKTEKKLFCLDNVNKLTDSELRSLYGESDYSFPLSELRNNLFKKVYSLFDVAAENAVLSPGHFEKAWLYRGTAPGSVLGELLRSIAQFKSYPLTYVDRVMINGWRDARGGQARLAWATQMFLGTLPLSILSTYLDYLGQGLSFPDIREMDASEASKFGLEIIQPNMGVWFNILDVRNQNSGLIAAQFNTPSIRLLSEALSSPLALITGHPDEAEKSFKKAINHILPLQTIPGLAPYMKGMLDQKTFLQPGQYQLYGN